MIPKKRLGLSIASLVFFIYGYTEAIAQEKFSGIFVGYELMEMSQNEYKNFAGEIGVRTSKDHQFRLAYMDVVLTERHLANKNESTAVEGGNVEGTFRLYELNFDSYFGSSSWYWSLSAGKEHTMYRHMILGTKAELNSYTIGSGFGYYTSRFLWIDGLMFNFSYPVRYFFSPLRETTLGNTTVRDHIIVNNIWIFIGVHF